MMRRFNILFVLLIILFAVPALAQDATPTAEGEPAIVEPVVIVDDDAQSTGTLQSVMDFIIEGDLIQWGLMFVMVFFLGNSVPQSKVDAGIIKAEQTETPVDDVLWQILDAINGSRTDAPAEPEPEPDPPADDPAPDPPPALPTQPVNASPVLRLAGYETEVYDGRTVEVPFRWKYYHELGREATHVDVFHKETGFEMKLDHRSGSFGFEQTVYLRNDFQYKLEIFCNAKLAGENWQDNIRMKADIFDEGGTRLMMPDQTFQQGYNGFEWVMDPPPGSGNYTLRVFVHMQWGVMTDDSSVLWEMIALRPLAKGN